MNKSPSLTRYYRPQAVYLTVAFLAASALLVFVLAVDWRGRQAIHEVDCRATLHAIGVALHRYHETYGTFPPAVVTDQNGKPMHSWRVLVLEAYHPELFRAYDWSQPWNSPKNAVIADKCNLYRCRAAGGKSEWTSYVAIVGPRTLFPGSQTAKLSDVQRNTAEVICVVEVQSDIHWMEPRDLEITHPSNITLSSVHPEGPAVLMVNTKSVRDKNLLNDLEANSSLW